MLTFALKYDIKELIGPHANCDKAVRSPETIEFELSFYEQGIERDLLFTRGPSDQIAVDCRTWLKWNPIRSVEYIDATALEAQLIALVKSFAQAAQIICPSAVKSRPFRAWLSETSTDC
ncbi:MAG TPA: hypothetical protein VI479_02485 [Blastocatellia bacterium]